MSIKNYKLFNAILIVIVLISCGKEQIKNSAPNCLIISPLDGDEIKVGEKVNILVEATDTDGTITEIHFYINDIYIGVDREYPYEFIWDTASRDIGLYNIKIKAIDNQKAEAINTIFVGIVNAPISEFTAEQTEIFREVTVQFEDKSTNNPTSWSWDFDNDGIVDATTKNPTHTYIKAGVYTVSLETSNDFGKNKIIKEEFIKVNIEYGSVIDYERNIYTTVKIGDQWWMMENLRSTKYSDGTSIPHVFYNDEWLMLSDNNNDFAYCFYNNDPGLNYGALYTYAAVVKGVPYDGRSHVKGISPDGWHIPSQEEWLELQNYLAVNGYNYDGTIGENKISKSLASNHGWVESTSIGDAGYHQENNNSSGFNALPSGFKGNVDGRSIGAGYGAGWWSSSQRDSEWAQHIAIHQYFAGLDCYDGRRKAVGYSVRCVKD